MEFKDSLLYRTINIPVNYFKENSFYYWLLNTPYLLMLCAVGIPIALVVDLYMAINNDNQ